MERCSKLLASLSDSSNSSSLTAFLRIWCCLKLLTSAFFPHHMSVVSLPSLNDSHASGKSCLSASVCAHSCVDALDCEEDTRICAGSAEKSGTFSNCSLKRYSVWHRDWGLTLSGNEWSFRFRGISGLNFPLSNGVTWHQDQAMESHCGPSQPC